ncbi:hypothetical protein PHLCEN_2v11974, partial [Hermanssonia centrifuga]
THAKFVSSPSGRHSSLSSRLPLKMSESTSCGSSTIVTQPTPLSTRRMSSMGHVNRISRRIHGWSWQAFPIGMGTGAVYVTLAGLKLHPGKSITIVETAFYFLNMILFLLNTSTLLLQLILYPRQAKRLITDPTKGIFVPLVVLSFATIIIGTINYGVPTGRISADFIYGLFWTYVSMSVIVCFPMLMIWFNRPHDLTQFTPAWAFLTGFLDGHQANGAFVACGPPGFTALALISLGDAARKILKEHHLVSESAGEIWYASSVLSGLLLFGLAVFFFVFGALPYWFKLHKHLSEILGCWALTFPNVGWILTLRKLGDIFGWNGFNIWHMIMTILMCITWVVLFVLTAIAFWKGEIFISTPEEIIRDTYWLDMKLNQDPEKRGSDSEDIECDSENATAEMSHCRRQVGRDQGRIETVTVQVHSVSARD